MKTQSRSDAAHDLSRLRRLIRRVREERRSLLLEHEGYAVMEIAGLRVPRHAFLDADRLSLAAVESDWAVESQVVLKIVSPQILHKSDVGGVRFCSGDAPTLEATARQLFDEVADRCPDAELSGVLVVERLDFEANAPGRELLLSMRRDPAFGPVLMVGPGGLLTEWYGELSSSQSHTLFSARSFRSRDDIETLRGTPFGRLLLEPSRLYREAPVDTRALGRALEGLAWLGELQDEDGAPLFEEVELNPAVVGEVGVCALDAVVRLVDHTPAIRRERPVEKIRSLLHPKSAAVYGASATNRNAGRIILSNLKRAQGLDYGRLYVVHPKADRIDGVQCCPTTADLPEKVDLAVVSVPAAVAPDTLDELIRLDRAESIILIPGGFAESGGDDRAAAIQDSLARSRDSEGCGPVMVGGNCLGIVSKGEYNTFFLPQYKLPFHRAPGDDLAVISQSGAYLVTFTSNLDGIIFPRASISYGNEMDLTASDFFEYYLDHEAGVHCFSFYIEGFQPGEGERFLQLVRRATADGRSVCVYKAGQTPVGAKAAASHTASIAGDYEVVRSLLSQAGATVCQTLNMFEDVTKIQTMLRDKVRTGNRVGVITNAGFEAGAMSDHLYSLELAEFSAETRSQLEGLLPEIAHCGNPIDCTPMTRTAEFIRAVEVMAAAPEVDALVVSAIPVTPALNVLAPDLSGRHHENAFAMKSLPAELIRVFEQFPKPLVVAIDSGRLYDPSVLLLERAGVPVYRKIDRASRALSMVLAE